MVLVHKTETLPKGEVFPVHILIRTMCSSHKCAAVRQFEGQVLIL